MRINVYSQELTGECKLVEKRDERGNIHYGVRIFFDGSPRLHNVPGDDDRSAITFWIPNGETFTKRDLGDVLTRMANMAYRAPSPQHGSA